MNPKVSVIVPCFNSEPYLAETLESVLDQSFKDWECIIINDGSTDNTEAVALEFTKKDTRFKLIYTPDIRISASRNAGIQLATGQYILPLDGDDKISEDYVAACVHALDTDPSLEIVYCEAEFFDGKSGRWDLPPFDNKTFALANIIFCTAMFRKKTWSVVGGFDEYLRMGHEDWEFWMSIIERGGKVKKLPIIGFFYRIRRNSLTVRLISHEKRNDYYNYVRQKHYIFCAEQLGDIATLYRECENYRIFVENVQSKWVYKAYSSIKAFLKPRKQAVVTTSTHSGI